MTPKIIQQSPLISTLDGFLTDNYCQSLIEQSEAEQYEPALITIGDHEYRKDFSVRNNDRVVFDSPKLAQSLFNEIKPCLPQIWNEGLWDLSGLNERFRYYRYSDGQTFKPHFDGYYERRRGHRSFLTLLFYLNDEFTGGETKFYKWQDDWYDKTSPTHIIEPKKGSALIFAHKQLHEGAPVLSGTKYVLRTDVMYHAIVL